MYSSTEGVQQDYPYGYNKEEDNIKSFSPFVNDSNVGRAEQGGFDYKWVIYIGLPVVGVLVLAILIYCLRRRIARWLGIPRGPGADLESATASNPSSTTPSSTLNSKGYEVAAKKNRTPAGGPRGVEPVAAGAPNDRVRVEDKPGRRGRDINLALFDKVTVVSEGAQNDANRRVNIGTLMVRGVEPFLPEHPKTNKAGRVPATIKDTKDKE